MVRVELAQLFDASWACGRVVLHVWPPALATNARVIRRGVQLTLAAGYALARPRRESGRSPFASPVVVNSVFFVGRNVEAFEFAPSKLFFLSFALYLFAERLRGLR